jgi:hypothetical protein
MINESNHIIPAGIIEEYRRGYCGVITEYHVSADICVLFKTRDLVLIKKTEPNKGKKKKVISWRKKTCEEINNILENQDWKECL